jgi:hypothetical protein
MCAVKLLGKTTGDVLARDLQPAAADQLGRCALPGRRSHHAVAQEQGDGGVFVSAFKHGRGFRGMGKLNSNLPLSCQRQPAIMFKPEIRAAM